MDGILHQHDWPLGRVQLCRIEHTISGSDHDVEIAAFAGLAESFNAHLLWRCLGDAFQIGHRLAGIRRGAVVGLFRGRKPDLLILRRNGRGSSYNQRHHGQGSRYGCRLSLQGVSLFAGQMFAVFQLTNPRRNVR